MRKPLDPIPMADAVRIVNRNIAKITGTLKASGAVDGHFTLPDGRRQHYHVDGILFYLAPTYVRFDLKVLGDRQFLFGSNRDYYWYYSKQEDAYGCGRQDEVDKLAPEIPVRPDQLVDALGLTTVPAESRRGASFDLRGAPRRLQAAVRIRHVQRVVDDYQQILCLVHDERDKVALEKEYWLDRYPPRLIRRVIFRNADGVVTMASRLDDYRPLAAGGPLLPYLMTAEWPTTDARMRFRVARWTLAKSVGPDAIQFAPPPECADR